MDAERPTPEAPDWLLSPKSSTASIIHFTNAHLDAAPAALAELVVRLTGSVGPARVQKRAATKVVSGASRVIRSAAKAMADKAGQLPSAGAVTGCTHFTKG